MDIQRNPGPSAQDFRSIAQNRSMAPYLNLPTTPSNRLNYSRYQLFRLKSKHHVSPYVFLTLKNLGILNTRRKRAGRRHISPKPRSIPVIFSPRISLSFEYTHYRGVNTNNFSIPLRLPLIPQVTQPAKLCLLNARSVCNKSLIINDFVVESNIDILCLTETWLKSKQQIGGIWIGPPPNAGNYRPATGCVGTGDLPRFSNRGFEALRMTAGDLPHGKKCIAKIRYEA